MLLSLIGSYATVLPSRVRLAQTKKLARCQMDTIFEEE